MKIEWGATLSSPLGLSASLTLPGDSAGGNLDIVVKKMWGRGFGRVCAPARAGEYVLAPVTRAVAFFQPALAVEEYVRGSAQQPLSVGAVRWQVFPHMCKLHQACSQGEIRFHMARRCILMTVFEEESV
jgi:hypothetical protein